MKSVRIYLAYKNRMTKRKEKTKYNVHETVES